MIPSVLARQVRQGVEDFLRTTFPISTPFFHGLIDRLLEENGTLFKGPYLSIQLPFRSADGAGDFFPSVPLQFHPYLHQEQAFRRIAGPRPRSTIVATGTGSGKTECFLFPILDHCYLHRGEAGIKAILIYPMNALANDQAKRLAKVIWGNSKLKGQVTAGLFVGDSEKEPQMVMGPENIITEKNTLRLKPPDILLTNYKMLDYLLIRPKDFSLWQHNRSDTLQYLVVDELHTFDGAQGTDLACLLRRLKARLATPREFLCCVGTSATLGSQDERLALLEYASQVFGEPFEAEAVIGESRLSVGEFLEQCLVSRTQSVASDKNDELDPETYSTYPQYLRAQIELWHGTKVAEEDWERAEWRVDLGEKLKSHLFFQNLLKVLGGKVRTFEEILLRMGQVTPELRNSQPAYRSNLLNSMLALISEARIWKPGIAETAPFLDVRLQVWLRELRRMVGEVRQTPGLRFADDLQEIQLKNHLPIVHCRECGSTAWAGTKRQSDTVVNSDLETFYVEFFNEGPKVVFLFPEPEDLRDQQMDGEMALLCGGCLRLSLKLDAERCPSCQGQNLIRVFVPISRVKRNDRVVGIHQCPSCGAYDDLTVLGSRAASLTSVMISQIYASKFNDDKKLLAFSDSVQDAAHRAGFFAARTYRFNLRSAIQQFVSQAGSGLTLAELPAAFARHWSERLEPHAYICAFLAPNMTWHKDYDGLLKTGKLADESSLPQYVNQRLGWEILSEYGFN